MEQQLYDVLGSLNIEYEKFEHEAFFTCAESEHFHAQHEGAHCKTLFLRNRKKTAYFLAVVMSDHRVDIKELTKFLEVGQKLSFASPADLEHFLGVQPGSVTPLALIHPEAKGIKKLLVDRAIHDYPYVHFHPLRNTATLRIDTKDFFRFLESIEIEMVEYGFGEV